MPELLNFDPSFLAPAGPPRPAPAPLLVAVARHKLLVGLPVVLALGVGAILCRTLPRQYSAEATVALDMRQLPTAANEVALRLPQDNAALRTELDIIGSRSLAEYVVDRLGLATDPGVLSEVAGDDGAGAWLGRLADAAHLGPSWWTPFARQVAPEAPQVGSAEVVDWLLGRLKTTNDGRSFTMFVSVTSHDPQRAARIANAVAQGYLDEQTRRKEAVTRRAGDRMAEKLTEMRQSAADADAAVTAYRQVSGLLEANGQTAASQQLSELTTQLALARAERARIEGKLKSGRSSNTSALSDVLASQTVQELRVQLSRAELKVRENERDLLLAPDLRATVDILRKQLAAETARIVSSLGQDATAAQAREDSLRTSIQHLQSENSRTSSGQVRLNELLREADASRAVYQSFLARYKQTIEHAGLEVPDALLISTAQPPSVPVFPKPVPIMLIAGLAGILAGVGAAAAQERSDGRVRDLAQIDVIAGLPVLGVLPNLSRRYRRRRPSPRLSMALQWLRVAALPAREPGKPRVVLVTSAVAGEGKTSLCAAFAYELARSGERVLVVDAAPGRFRLASVVGMWARGEPHLEPDSEGQRKHSDVNLESGVHFIASSVLSNFQPALRSASFAELLDYSLDTYDVVFLDASSVESGAAPAALAELADVHLFVIRRGRTYWNQMLSALSLLRLGGSRVDGLVVVDADPRDLYRLSSVCTVPGTQARLAAERRLVAPLSTSAVG